MEKKNTAFNPYLPSWEYVPDAEPHIFYSEKDKQERVYVYGSHDAFGAPIFCVNDYVCWSAPTDDLTDWRYEGVIFSKKSDPTNPFGIRSLYAPDCVRGVDGRYYLYYAFDFLGRIGVAVCDEPAGQYTYYGCVQFADGHIWGTKSKEPFPFDPGVLVDDDGRVWLYSGFATKVPFVASRWHNLTNEGGVVVELKSDMLTIAAGPKLLFPTASVLDGLKQSGKATKEQLSFQGHSFFEASSIRKVDGRYCFVYSSQHNHELCCAFSDRPDSGFTYGGTLIDLGDLYLSGEDDCDEASASNYLGNTHGGICDINGEWYIFYHRQTNRSSYARQACAERLRRREDGGFYQAELTSCGLNKTPLDGLGRYEARIACNLWSKEGTGRYDVKSPKRVFAKHPYFTQTGSDYEPGTEKEPPRQYIANMYDGAVAGFKYFSLCNAGKIVIELGGSGDGQFIVSTKPDLSNPLAEIPVSTNGSVKRYTELLKEAEGEQPLFFGFKGRGYVDFMAFILER